MADTKDNSNLYELKETSNKVKEIALAQQYIKEVLVAVSGLAVDADVINEVYLALPEIRIVAGIDAEVVIVSGISGEVVDVAAIDAEIVALAGISAEIATVAGISADVTGVNAIASDVTAVNTDPLRQSILDANTNATNAQLEAWNAEAEKMTADSYATEPEDVFVKLYTSDGDGTFTATDTTENSSLHWAAKAAASPASPTGLPQSKVLEGTTVLPSVNTKTFDSITYTGNSTGQNIVTGIASVDFTVVSNGSGFYLDRTTFEVKNDAGTIQASGTCDCNVSKVHIKSRGQAWKNLVFDGLRGGGEHIVTDTTDVEALNVGMLSGFNSNGFSLGAQVYVNDDTETYIAYQTLYTRIKWGTTNQGKKYVEAYNPVTLETMVMYEGSGNNGHNIPHSVGGTLGYIDIKSLNVSTHWYSSYASDAGMSLNNNWAENTTFVPEVNFEDGYMNPYGTNVNNAFAHILYGKANSSTWKIVNTGTAIEMTELGANDTVVRKITKNTTTTGNWEVIDYARGNTKQILLNTSGIETTVTADTDVNATDGSYDDSPTGTDITLTDGLLMFSDGYDESGAVNSVEAITGSIAPTYIASATNYLKKIEGGAWEATINEPSFGSVSATSDYYIDGVWYNSSDVAYATPITYLDHKVTTDGNGSPVTLEAFDYADIVVDKIVATTIKGNLAIDATSFNNNLSGSDDTAQKALDTLDIMDILSVVQGATAWVNFDGTTTPPSIRSSFNVSSVTEVSNAVFRINFTVAMDNGYYTTVGGGTFAGSDFNSLHVGTQRASSIMDLNYAEIMTSGNANVASEGFNTNVQIFGGKN